MDSEGTIEFQSVVCSNNSAGASGGCFHGWGAGFISNWTLMENNTAESGAAMRECKIGAHRAICICIVRRVGPDSMFQQRRVFGCAYFVLSSCCYGYSVRSSPHAQGKSIRVYCSTLADIK